MRKLGIVVFLVLLSISLVTEISMAGSKQAKSAKVLKAVSVMPIDLPNMRTQKLWIDEVNNRSNGELIIKYLGSTDVIPIGEQIESLRAGVVDIVLTFGPLLAGYSPLAHAMLLTGMTPWEERKAGIWDLYREVFAKEANVYWMFQTQSPTWFVLTATSPVNNLKEMKGLKIRCSNIFLQSMKALGASPVFIPTPDIYNALQRGVCDGLAFPPSSWLAMGFGEVMKYWIGPRLSFGQAGAPVMNLGVWKSLSRKEKDWLMDSQLHSEQVWYGYDYYLGAGPTDGEEAIIKSGVKRIAWPEEDNKQAIRLWDEAVWNSIKDKIDPKVRQRFSKLTGMK